MKRYSVRPSKTVSLIQFFMSAVFIVVGVALTVFFITRFALNFIKAGVQSMPTLLIVFLLVFLVFLVGWTSFAVWACIYSARNAFGKKGVPYEYMEEVEEDSEHKQFRTQYSTKEVSLMKRYRVRPSRTISVIGFIIGIGMCVLGVYMFFTAIKSGGGFSVAFMLVWVIGAVSGVILNAKNAFTKKGVAYQYIEEVEEDSEHKSYKKGSPELKVVEMTPSPSDADLRILREDLRKLERLLNSGTITKPQYDRAKNEILRKNIQRRA